MFVLGVSFVATMGMMGMMGMMTPSVMSILVVPLLAGHVEPNEDMTMAGDLVVAQLVICRNKYESQFYFFQYFPSYMAD